jgi:hypothetical protein
MWFFCFAGFFAGGLFTSRFCPILGGKAASPSNPSSLPSANSTCASGTLLADSGADCFCFPFPKLVDSFEPAGFCAPGAFAGGVFAAGAFAGGGGGAFVVGNAFAADGAFAGLCCGATCAGKLFRA